MTSDADEIRQIAESIRRRRRPPEPRKIGDAVNALLAKRGYGQILAAEELQAAWREAAGKMLAGESRATQIRNGVLEVIVGSSIVLQELMFQKRQLTAKLAASLASQPIRDIRFRVGVVE